MKRHSLHLFCLLAIVTFSTQAATITYISSGTSWRYVLGTQEASSPIDAWRAIGFNDGSWSSGNSPLGYGQAVTTTLPNPNTGTPYTSVYLRKTFNVANPADLVRLDAIIQIDDGYVAWINGTEIGRNNVGEGGLFFNDTASVDGAPHVTTISLSNNLSTLLVAGANVLTVHAFNAVLPNNDMFFDAALTGLTDDQAPTILSIIPEAGTLVRELNQIQVNFTEPVTGVDVGDFLINGAPASEALIVTPSQVQFQFTQPPTGTVNITWAAGHNITDLANTPNAFVAVNWSYTLDTNFTPSVVINEFLASNSGGANSLRDDDGRDSDWIEIYNRGNQSVNLQNWSITDNNGSRRKYVFPAVTLLPNSYLVLIANDPPVNPASYLYLGFNLSAGGEYLGLFDANTNLMSQFPDTYPNPSQYPPQQPDISYGRDQVDPNVVGYCTPTPGGPNVFQGTGVAPEVVFSHDGGTFTNNFFLTLSTPADPGAIIRYVIIKTAGTTNLTIPTATSPTYTGPLLITNTCVVRARAFLPAGNTVPGAPRSECYIRLNTNVVGFTSDLPLVIVHTISNTTISAGGGAADTAVIVAFFERNNGTARLTDAPQVIKRAGINLRGSSTQGYPKSSFAVELWDEFNEDEDSDVLGLPSESDWVLYAPNHFDKVLIHNPVAYQVSRDIGRYASRTRLVEVFLKDDGGGNGIVTANMAATAGGMGDYNGVYVLEEKIKRDDSRVDIERLEPFQTNSPTITGGYLVKIDRVDSNERTFTAGNQSMVYQEPDGLEMVTPQRAAQASYLTTYFNNFYSVLTSASFTNPVTGYAAWIDVDAWIDHNMLGVLTLNADWLRLSGFFHKKRSKKIEMGPIWDHDRAEGTSPDSNGGVDNDWRAFAPRNWIASASLGGGGDYGADFFNSAGVFANPWYSRLFTDVDFWQKWIDRYDELRRGPLDTNNILAMIDELAAEVSQAQVREVQRWGGQGQSNTRPRSGIVRNSVAGTGLRAGYQAYTNEFDGTYLGPQGEIAFLKRWWSDRINFIDTNFLRSPILSVPAGPVTPGTELVIVDVSGKPGTTIYYTLDGTDPRQPGGGIAPGALTYSGPVTINSNARVFARARNLSHNNVTGANNPPRSSPWSGPAVATYVTATPPLRITEIMYHPADPPSGTNDDNNFEYIEVKNIGATPLNLSRFALTEGVQFQFPSVVLNAGQSAVVVAHTNAFRSRYGSGPLVLGVYEGRLDNGGERIVLEGALKEPIHDFSYNDNWYPSTDGHGFSLVIVNDTAPLNTWGLKTSWRASTAINGSPSADDPAAPNIPLVVINEVLTHTDLPQVDAIELRNLTGAPANVGGWFLTDDFGDPKKFRLTNGTVIAAGGFRAFLEGEFGSGLTGFALSEHGEEVWLFSGDGVNLTGYAHGFDFGAAENGVSFGRHIISTGEDHFPAQAGSPTLNFANAGPRVGPIVISEINYHPPPVVLIDENFEDEYIEIHNITGATVPLYDPAHPTNRWQLRDAVDFIFPQTNMAPNGYALVVSFDPANPQQLATFRSRVGVSASVPIFGPFSGRLANSEDSVELVKPGAPEPPGPPDFGLVPEILVERVRYRDESPWPIGADGFGPTLQRVNTTQYGNDPANWVAAARTPGAAFGGGSAPVITQQPTNQTVVAFNPAAVSVSVTGTGPFSYQWLFNSNAIPGANSATLAFSSIQPAQEGFYAVIVMNSAGSVLSAQARIDVLMPAAILQHPTSIAVRGSTNLADFGQSYSNITFFVGAVSENPPVTYQWRRDGTNIPGATSTSLTIDDVAIPDEGTYDVRVTDQIGSILSDPAQLEVMVPVVYTSHPESQIVAEGETASLVLEVRGHPFPITYRWRSGGLFVQTNFSDSLTSTLTIPNATIGTGQVYTCIATNRATPFGASQGLTRAADVTVVVPPNNQVGIAQGNVTFIGRASAGPTRNSAISHRWQFNGVDIPGATTTNLVLSNLRPHHAGVYTYTASNSVAGQARSFNATLTVLEPDSDGDGAPDWHEADAGTNPNDPSSYLHISDVERGVGGTSVEFLAISNRTYSVQYSTTVDAANWFKLVDVSAHPTNRVERLTDPSGDPTRFYRLISPQVP